MLLSCCHICDVGRWQPKSPWSWICPLKRFSVWALECSPAWTMLGSPLGLNRWSCCETKPCASRGIHLDGLQHSWIFAEAQELFMIEWFRETHLWCEVTGVLSFLMSWNTYFCTNLKLKSYRGPISLHFYQQQFCSNLLWLVAKETNADILLVVKLCFFLHCALFTNGRLLCWGPFAFPATKPKGVNGCAHGAPESWLSYERNNF